MNEMMNTEIRDVTDRNSFTKVSVRSEAQSGVGIWISGYSTTTAANDCPDAVAYLEVKDGKPMLRVWADINQEEPTHTIDLSGAHIGRRLTTFKGNLYFVDDQGVKRHLAEFEMKAESAKVLEKKVLDEHWDDRLDAASCSPHFEYEVVVDG